MGAIFRREIKAFFTNPIGYVVLAVMYCLSGYFFFHYNLSTNSADMTNVFVQLFTVVVMALPFLTMRLFSEEKRQKTDQALLTAPVSLTGIVVGIMMLGLTKISLVPVLYPLFKLSETASAISTMMLVIKIKSIELRIFDRISSKFPCLCK